jgi:prevent-host-death family protein
VSHSIHSTKNNLSKLLKRVKRGESIVITNRNEAVAQLVPIRSTKREFGFFSGQIKIADDFDAPLEEFEAADTDI